MQPIHTARLTLRPLHRDDLEDLFSIYSDAGTCRYTLDEPWTDQTKTEAFAKHIANQHLSGTSALNAAVESNGRVIGEVLAWYTHKDTVEIGYVFHKDCGGQGFALEAVRALVDYLFAEHGLHRITANMDARNHASAKLCRKLGMRQEAHFIQDYWNKGEWTDSLIFALLRSEYRG